MEKKEAVLLEFVARKEQILNLELRLFILIFALEALFLFVYVYNAERVRQSKTFTLCSALVYFVLFFEMVAINGKMGVVSMYLRQMESYLASLGYVGVVWETKALDMIIFPPGNAFTLPAGLTVLCLLVQTLYLIYAQISHFAPSTAVRAGVTAIAGIVLLLLIAKTISVDFYRELPQVFAQMELPATNT